MTKLLCTSLLITLLFNSGFAMSNSCGGSGSYWGGFQALPLGSTVSNYVYITNLYNNNTLPISQQYQGVFYGRFSSKLIAPTPALMPIKNHLSNELLAPRVAISDF